MGGGKLLEKGKKRVFAFSALSEFEPVAQSRLGAARLNVSEPSGSITLSYNVVVDDPMKVFYRACEFL